MNSATHCLIKHSLSCIYTPKKKITKFEVVYMCVGDHVLFLYMSSVIGCCIINVHNFSSGLNILRIKLSEFITLVIEIISIG
jgi:hypothetical protein